MYIGLVNVIMTILLFLDSLATPLFVSSSMRRDRDTITRQFVFSVLGIYCELMFCLASDTCTVRMASLCQLFLVFPRMIFHLYYAFPSFFIVASFFFSYGHFVSPELSSSSLIFLPLVSSFLKLSLFPSFSSFQGRFFPG